MRTITLSRTQVFASDSRFGRAFWMAFALVPAIVFAKATPTALQAEEYVVNDAGDASGTAGLTLREAIAQAQATPDDDRIIFAGGITEIRLAQGELLLGHLFMSPKSGSLEIDGGEGVTIDAGGKSGVMDIQSGSVTLTGLNFINGNTPLGGGLMVWDGTNVALSNSVVAFNTASAGGGIYNAGTLAVTNTLVWENDSSDTGGGIHVNGRYEGRLAADNLVLSDNAARAAGGGLFNDGAEVMLIAPIVEYNSARNGGGIYNCGGSLDLSGGEFTGNQASRNGNDVYYTSGSVDPADLVGLDVFEEKPKGGGRK